MKTTISIITMLMLLSACNSGSSTSTAKEGQAKIVAIYTKPDGSKYLDVMYREIVKTIKTDQNSGMDKVVLDTLWGYPSFVAAKDSLGRPVFDSTGKQKFTQQLQFLFIHKDSVNWKIENIPLTILLKPDSLSKRN